MWLFYIFYILKFGPKLLFRWNITQLFVNKVCLNRVMADSSQSLMLIPLKSNLKCWNKKASEPLRLPWLLAEKKRSSSVNERQLRFPQQLAVSCASCGPARPSVVYLSLRCHKPSTRWSHNRGTFLYNETVSQTDLIYWFWTKAIWHINQKEFLIVYYSIIKLIKTTFYDEEMKSLGKNCWT